MKDIAILAGNGINTISDGITWAQLLDEIIRFCGCRDLSADKDKPFPLFYEEIFLNALANGTIRDENELKTFIAGQVSTIPPNDIHALIRAAQPAHVMTTNYEFLLEGMVPEQNDGIVNESKFSVFRKYLVNDTSFWHIHGDCNNPASVNLGYEHYSGQLQKMRNYVTSVTDYRTKGLQKNPLAARLRNRGENFVIQSWIDLLFVKDIHIIGLNLSFAETDLWWLLTYRARMIQYERKFRIDNKIIYYVPEAYYKKDDFRIKMLTATGVTVQPVDLPHSSDYYKHVISEW